MTEEMEIKNMDELQNSIKVLMRNRGVKVSIKIYTNKTGNLESRLEVKDWPYVPIFKEDSKNFHDGYAYSVRGENYKYFYDYYDLDKLLTDIYKTIIYIVSTYDSIKQRELNYTVEFEL
ncbi:MAG: hypothetical protein ACP5L4_01960 [Thermoplasmata archaeon]